ncbi:MAG: sugar ABC transporter substrate-binding protein, partial [Acidobacteria bacterium]
MVNKSESSPVVKGTQESGKSVGEDFIIGSGDVLNIFVWKELEVSRSVPVRPDGKISLPLVNDV